MTLQKSKIKSIEYNIRDKVILLLGLNASLWPDEIKGLQIDDVYDGKQVKENITIRAKIARFGQKREIKIDRDIQRTIADYIEWKVKNEESTEPFVPLFVSHNGGYMNIIELYKIITQIFTKYNL